MDDRWTDDVIRNVLNWILARRFRVELNHTGRLTHSKCRMPMIELEMTIMCHKSNLLDKPSKGALGFILHYSKIPVFG